MLWAPYFIRVRIIEIGSLQFGYKNNKTIKIQIYQGFMICLK